MNKKNKKLYGLVLTGGQSKRMETDKSMIDYHGESQVEHCVKLLSQYCEKVFISNREDQVNISEHKKYPQIHDIYLNIGPLSGILSAMKNYQEASWFVLACDLPFVNHETLKTLIKKRNSSKVATAYRSVNDDLPEPLCTIYEAHGHKRLTQLFNEGITCPRKILMNCDIEMIDQEHIGLLDNINSPIEYQNAFKKIKNNEYRT